MGDVPPTQKVKRVTKKTKSTVVEPVPVVSSETQSPEDVVESNVKTTSESATASTSVPGPAKEKEIRLTEIPVVDEITALNLMVSFLGLAQKRGAYTIDEASKIWECIKKFQRPV